MRYHHLTLSIATLLIAGCATVPATIAPTRTAGTFHPPGYLRGDKKTPSHRVIIFVHGIFGDGIGTWTNPNGAYFPELIRDDPTFAGTDIWVHDFPSPKLGRTYNLDQLAEHLRKYLNDDNVITNHREIIFLAHSMGGIVTRAYLLQNRDLTPDRVPLLYFFSTPTTGSEVANLARVFSKNPQLVDLRPMKTNDGGILGVYQTHWQNSPLRQVRTYCAYEILPTRGIQVVERASATQLCTMRFDPINRDHMSIVKPADSNKDETYIAFREAYLEVVRRQPVTVSEPRPIWNLSDKDSNLIRIANVTKQPNCKTCWDAVTKAAPGETISIALYYHNGANTTETGVRLRVTLPRAPFKREDIIATLTSDHSPPIHGKAHLHMEDGLTSLLPDSLEWYPNTSSPGIPLPYEQKINDLFENGVRLGDVGPTWFEQGHLVVRLRTIPVNLLLIPDIENWGTSIGAALKDPNTPLVFDERFLPQQEGRLQRDYRTGNITWLATTTAKPDQEVAVMLVPPKDSATQLLASFTIEHEDGASTIRGTIHDQQGNTIREGAAEVIVGPSHKLTHIGTLRVTCDTSAEDFNPLTCTPEELHESQNIRFEFNPGGRVQTLMLGYIVEKEEE